jgi:phosphohistidine phosphatase SixA
VRPLLLHSTRSSATPPNGHDRPGAATELAGPPVEHYNNRIYGAPPETLLAVLHDLPDTATTAVLIGHNPGTQDLVAPERVVRRPGRPGRPPGPAAALVVLSRSHGIAVTSCSRAPLYR